jgi:putative polyhydroxyalkanoate system protein
MGFGSTVDVSRKHNLSIDHVKQCAMNIAADMSNKYSINYKLDGYNIIFDAPIGAAKGTSGRLDITDNSIRIKIILPFMLYAFKGSIEETVNEKLDEYGLVEK